MEFDNIKNFVLHGISNPAPVDVKIGDEYAYVKINRTGNIHKKRYIPEKSYNIDISNIPEVDREKHIVSIVGKDLDNKDHMVAIINGDVYTVRKINNYTIILFHIRPKYKFSSDDEMKEMVDGVLESINRY